MSNYDSQSFTSLRISIVGKGSTIFFIIVGVGARLRTLQLISWGPKVNGKPPVVLRELKQVIIREQTQAKPTELLFGFTNFNDHYNHNTGK